MIGRRVFLKVVAWIVLQLGLRSDIHKSEENADLMLACQDGINSWLFPLCFPAYFPKKPKDYKLLIPHWVKNG